MPPRSGQAIGYSVINPDDVEQNDLDMERHRLFRPLRDMYGSPRLVVAQLDCIRLTCVLRPLVKPLLKVLTMWIAERRHGCWLSIFFTCFIFLREIALATRDAYAHGQHNPKYEGFLVSSWMNCLPRQVQKRCDMSIKKKMVAEKEAELTNTLCVDRIQTSQITEMS